MTQQTLFLYTITARYSCRKWLIFSFLMTVAVCISVAQNNCMISENNIYYLEGGKLFKKDLIGSTAPVEIPTDYAVEKMQRLKTRISLIYSEPTTVTGIVVNDRVVNYSKEEAKKEMQKLTTKNPSCERRIPSTVKSKLIPLGRSMYRNHAYVALLTGSAFKCDEPYEIHYDTGSWITTIPKVLLNMDKLTVIKEDVNNGWPGITCDLVKGTLALVSLDGTKYEIQDYPFYASKTYTDKDGKTEVIKSDIGQPYGVHTGSSIMGAFPSHFSQDGIPSLPYALAKKHSIDNNVNFGFGVVHDCEPYLQIGPNPVSTADLKWRTDIPNWRKAKVIQNQYNIAGVPKSSGFNPEVIPGFKFKISFPGQNKVIETSDELLATIDTGAPIATLKLGPDDPQDDPAYAGHFVAEGSYYGKDENGNWTGWGRYEEVKTLVNATVTVEFTSSECETFTYSYSVGNDPKSEPNSLYAAKWNSDAPWTVSKPAFPKNRINLGNTIYKYISIYYYDIENERIGFGFKDGVKKEHCKIADIDGNVYPTTKIGEQTWLAENLRVTRGNDGYTILRLGVGEDLEHAAMYWHENNPEDEKSKAYGPLYNWYAIKNYDVCPIGWHVPSQSEWNQLIRKWYEPGREGAAGLTYAAYQLRETGGDYWKNNTKTTNSSGFNALPGGWLWNGGFYYVGRRTAWWGPANDNKIPIMTKIADGDNGTWTAVASKKDIMYVRCLKDADDPGLSQN